MLCCVVGTAWVCLWGWADAWQSWARRILCCWLKTQLSQKRFACAHCRQRQPQAAEGRLPARALSAAARTLDNSPRASPQRALTSALPATAAAIADGASDAKQQLQKLALALPPIPDSAAEAAAASPEGLEQPPPPQQQGQQPGSHPPQQVPAGGGQAAPSSELLSPEAGRLLAEAVAASRAARDAWQLPLSLQAHGALALNDLALVPADASEIWGSIKGYHGTGERLGEPNSAVASGL